MNLDSPSNPLYSSECFLQSTPQKISSKPQSSPFSQFCMSSLSPIPANSHSPEISPVFRRALFSSSRPTRSIQMINFSEIHSKVHIQASCVPVDIIIVPDSPKLPKVRARKKQEKSICCSCQKSRCLKMYCDCFAAKQYCLDCSCADCLNLPNNEETRKDAMTVILEKNPDAFKPKVTTENSLVRHYKGCNCKRSGCCKRYCECFQINIKCTDMCKCTGCGNREGPLSCKKKRSKKCK